MDKTQTSKTIIAAILVAVLLVVVYFFFSYNRTSPVPADSPENVPAEKEDNGVKFEPTPTSGGKMQSPEGFPADIPIESSRITESATTRLPGGAIQLSLTYTSSKSVNEVYSGTRAYMVQKGYEITEGSSSSAVRTIFGTSDEANLSVAVSTQGGVTTAQVSYLVK